jgi:hypothetical protein
MKYIYLVTTALAASASAFADTPTEERDFGEFAATGCKNRNGDFIIRGLVSSANEGTLVLSDPTNPQTTTSVTLPGRGGRSREGTNQTLSELRSSRTPVVVTMECKGEGTPIAREISYTYLDGTHAAISF